MTCDICSVKKADFFGRWLAWCGDCKEEGKRRDDKKTWDNEIQPDIDSGDFSYTLGQGLVGFLE